MYAMLYCIESMFSFFLTKWRFFGIFFFWPFLAFFPASILKTPSVTSVSGIIHVICNRVCNSKHSTPSEISLVFLNGSNYDYHLFLRELAKSVKENFLVPIRKKLKELVQDVADNCWYLQMHIVLIHTVR